MEFADIGLRILHALVGAIWLGSIYFSLMVLHRQSPELFDSLRGFEHFVTGLSDGNRWRVLSALSVTAVTGVALVGLSVASADDSYDATWWGLMAAKTVAVLVTSGVFWYVSWRLWPARVFATNEELPKLQKRGTLLRATMFAMVAVAFVLGVVASAM